MSLNPDAPVGSRRYPDLVTKPTEPSEQFQINVVMGWFEEFERRAPTN
jgi:hypothetical protein